ncbi:MAG: hypothetical protein ACQSGP_01170 [Frankia sp.]
MAGSGPAGFGPSGSGVVGRADQRFLGGAAGTDLELLARIELMSDQLMTARAEAVLARAAYNRACDDEAAASLGPPSPMAQLLAPRVARALAGRLAAVERFALWARELDRLQREARARGLLIFPG